MLSFIFQYNIKITCSVEDEPLGTAGPLKKAQKIINEGATLEFDKLVQSENNFIVMNSDIVCEFPLQEMIDFHKHHGKLATIMIS